MNNKVIWIVGAVIVALYFVFSRSRTPSGITTPLGIGLHPAGSSSQTALAASIGSLGSSIARALGGSGSVSGGGNPLGATITPAAAAGTGASPGLEVGTYYSQAIGTESLEEPTFASNTNSFTIVGTGPAPIAAPNVTPSNTPTPGVLAFLNPNGNLPPPILADSGSGNYSLDNSALLASGPSTNYGGGSLDGATYDYLSASLAAPAPVG